MSVEGLMGPPIVHLIKPTCGHAAVWVSCVPPKHTHDQRQPLVTQRVDLTCAPPNPSITASIFAPGNAADKFDLYPPQWQLPNNCRQFASDLDAETLHSHDKPFIPIYNAFNKSCRNSTFPTDVK